MSNKTSVRRLPHVNVRQGVRLVSKEEIDASGLHRIENVFWRGVKAWTRILLPNIELKCDVDLKIMLSIKSVVAAVSGELETAGTEPIHDHHTPSVAAPFDVDMLDTVPNTIRNVLVHETQYTSINSRILVPLATLPSAQVASLLAISKSYTKCLLFQAKVDKLYLISGVKLQEHSQTQSHVQRDIIHHAVNFI